MYLFKGSASSGFKAYRWLSERPISQKMRWGFAGLTGGAQSRCIGGLVLVLVLLLHLWAIIWLSQPAESATVKMQSMMMEVSLVSAPDQQASTAPIARPKSIEPKKQPVEKPVKKKKPVIRKQMELPKPLPKSEEMLPAPSTAKATPEPAAPSTAASVSSKVTSNTAHFTEANFQANYSSNPKPKYSAIATSRGWEGTVRLLVKVSVEGYSEKVTVHSSSGHDVLDEAAIEAVEKWRFIPAKRGDTPIASSVIVPINFTLNNSNRRF